MNITKKVVVFILICSLIILYVLPCSASEDILSLDSVIDKTAEYLITAVPEPRFGSEGGEWVILGLARSGCDIPSEYFERYYHSVEEYLKECGGVLDKRRHTEYSRLIIALTAIGKKPTNIAGFDLTLPLTDTESTLKQGINGAIWALIALDCGNYPAENAREVYIKQILDRRLSGGGWALTGNIPDPNITGMALQALAAYTNRSDVKSAVDNAVTRMSELQNMHGGFFENEVETSEGTAQMLTALCELKLSPFSSSFVKNGASLINCLSRFYKNGGFTHTLNDTEPNQISTEQAFYALVAAKRAIDGKPTLYKMSDAISVRDTRRIGLAGKSDAVHYVPEINSGIEFSDMTEHQDREAVAALAARGIINGSDSGLFSPDNNMTRAEFAAIIVRGLGLYPRAVYRFGDVVSSDWYFEYVGTAYSHGITTGTSDTEFTPDGTITREEAAVMITRAAKLCGLNTNLNDNVIRDSLAGFTDYMTAGDWAREALAFCCMKNIISNDETEIFPKAEIKRCEVARMLFNMLKTAQLL